MTVRVTREAEPQFDLFGAYEGEVLGGAENTLAHLTFTASGDYLIVVPKNDLSQPQVEVGDTPSSYIPTNGGSTVTRAGETLTAPSANLPWPEPVVIGEELVTNGTFDTDTDWTKGTVGTVTISGGVVNATDTTTIVEQETSLVSGKQYVATLDYTITSGQKLRIEGDGILVISDSIAGTGSGTLALTFTANDPTFRIAADAAVFTGTIDNVSVREINPLAVSIAMEGTVSYADNGLPNEAEFIRWRFDSNNRINHYLRTNVLPNDLRFQQAESGTFDTSDGGSYSPGVNVPFSIASRHGSTFINGAVDGTALTANTTPTALPDLSSTDLEIGPDFMGTIKSIRIWADDIGDDGIEEASS